jgi:hypothetical protein
MSLSEEEMKRIKAEEIFRQEIRAQLEKAKPSRTKTEKAWEFLNSAFGVWVLSTVIVGLITLAYTIHLDSVKKEGERKERSQKLEAEINNRRKETLKLLAYFKEKTKGVTYYDEPHFIYKEAVTFMDGKNDPDFLAFQPALYKEFKDENLAALLDELNKISETNTEDIKMKYDRLRDLYSQTQPSPAAIKGKPTDEERKRNVEAVDKAIDIINSR